VNRVLFNKKIESFGVLLKGCSLSEISKYKHNFNDCFIVNDFKEEIKHIGNDLIGKNVVHFVNRSHYAPLKSEQYRGLKLKKVQFYQVFNFLDIGHLVSWLRYKILLKQMYWLPSKLLAFNKSFGSEFKNKFPNTGILSVVYALEIIQPKELWIFGMDFYKANYLFRRKYHKSLEPQISKYDKLNIVDFTKELFASYPKTKIYLVTSYAEFPPVENVKKITVNC
jgi:hypothetical protein